MTEQFDFVSVRYLVDDVQAAVDFYTEHLGFEVALAFPPFADVRRGNLRLLLSGPQSSAGQPMTDGEVPKAGGWNRIVLRVADVAQEIERLKRAGLTFRNEMETGPGGRQVQIEDPDGNPIELFEPARR